MIKLISVHADYLGTIYRAKCLVRPKELNFSLIPKNDLFGRRDLLRYLDFEISVDCDIA